MLDDRDAQAMIQDILDPQAGMLYNSQQQVFYPGMDLEAALKMTPDFETQEQAQAYALKVQRSAFVKKTWPKFAAFKDLTVKFDATIPEWTSAMTNNTYPHEIKIGPSGWSRQKRTLLHELGHVIDNIQFGHAGYENGHGPVYAGILLKLLKQFVGDTPAQALAAQFKLNHVEVAK